MSKPVKKIKSASPIATGDYAGLVGGVSELLDRLATDLNSRFGRGFSRRNLQSMRQFCSFIPAEQIWQTVSAKSEPAAICSTLSGKSTGVIGSTPSNISQTPSVISSHFTLVEINDVLVA